MTRRRFFGLLPWLIGAALLVLIINTISLAEVGAIMRPLRLWQIGVLIVANGLVLLAISGRWWLLLAGQGYRVPFSQLFGYRLAVFGLSYFTPGPHVGGEPLQVLLVERGHGVPRSAALAAVALDKIIEFSTNFALLLLGVGAILNWRIVPQATGQQAAGLIAGLLLIPVLYLALTATGFFPLTRLFGAVGQWRLLRRWQDRLSAAATTLEAGERQVGEFYRLAPRSFIAAVVVSFLGWLALIVEYWLMVQFLGVTLSLPQLVTTLTAARLSILLLLPAGLGALELSQTLSFGLLGLNPAVGLSTSLLIRTRDTLLGAVGLWWGSRQISGWSRPSATDRQ